MTQWLQRRRRTLVALAMLAESVLLVLDGLAFLGVRPPVGQLWMSNLCLWGVLTAVLPRVERSAATTPSASSRSCPHRARS